MIKFRLNVLDYNILVTFFQSVSCLFFVLFCFSFQEVRPNSIADVKVDASFRRIPKNAICFHVWKIEEDRLEAVPKTQYGTFIDDCAYIIYASGPNNTFVNQDTIVSKS